jgi:hypothetical protein
METLCFSVTLASTDESAEEQHQHVTDCMRKKYFQYGNQLYKQNAGLAVAAQTFAVAAETYVQY